MDFKKFKFFGIIFYVFGSLYLGRSVFDVVELMNVGVNYLWEYVIDDVCIYYMYLDGGEKFNIVFDFV